MGRGTKVAIGCGILMAPLIGIGYGMGKIYAKITEYTFKYPKTAALGAIVAVTVAYNSSLEGIGEKAKGYLRRGESSIEQLVERYEHRNDAQRLQQYAQQVAAQNAQLSDALKRQQGYTTAIESKLAAAEREAQQRMNAPPPQVTAPQVTTPPPAPPTTIEHPDYYFYYVNVNDTLDGIGRSISGNAHAGRTIAADNSITDPRTLMAGQLLKIKRTLCTKATNLPLYERAPILESVILPGNIRISEFFQGDQRQASSALELNRRLGLRYDDAFPYQQGARVVYYRK